MSKWQKILLAVLGAAVTVLPYFVKGQQGQAKVEAIEAAAGEAIGEITRT